MRSEEGTGRFCVSVPREGVWPLCAQSPDARLAARPLPLDIRGTLGRNGVRLQLTPAAGLAGSAAPGAVVSIHPWAGTAVVTRPLASVRACAGGTLALPGLPTGACVLRCAFADGRTSRRDLMLHAGAGIEIDARGTPPSRSGGSGKPRIASAAAAGAGERKAFARHLRAPAACAPGDGHSGVRRRSTLPVAAERQRDARGDGERSP